MMVMRLEVLVDEMDFAVGGGHHLPRKRSIRGFLCFSDPSRFSSTTESFLQTHQCTVPTPKASTMSKMSALRLPQRILEPFVTSSLRKRYTPEGMT